VKSLVQDREGEVRPFYYTFSDGGVFGFYANGPAEQATGVLLVHSSITHSLPLLFDTITHYVTLTIPLSIIYLYNVL
jgi:hypothetical protein